MRDAAGVVRAGVWWGWKTARMVLSGPITTSRLVLRPITMDDVDVVHEIHALPEVVAFLFSETLSRDQAAENVAKSVGKLRLKEDDDRIRFAVDRGADGRMIGVVSIVLRSAEHRQGELGAVFHPDAQGQGYAVEAMDAVLALAFGQAGIHRVTAGADPRNEGSVALMRRLGMREEARFHQNYWFKGAWAGEVIYAILEDEWQQRRGAPDG